MDVTVVTISTMLQTVVLLVVLMATTQILLLDSANIALQAV